MDGGGTEDREQVDALVEGADGDVAGGGEAVEGGLWVLVDGVGSDPAEKTVFSSGVGDVKMKGEAEIIAFNVTFPDSRPTLHFLYLILFK